MKSLAYLLGGALLATGLATPVLIRAAELSQAPIRIDRCSFSTLTLSSTGSTGAVQVGFTITGAVPADQVAFHVIWGDGDHENDLVDVGHFTPGVSIFHALEFRLIGNVTGATFQLIRLQVTRVHLADGSVWALPPTGGSGPEMRCAVYLGGSPRAIAR